MNLYIRLLFLLGCTRAWFRSFWAFSKALKVAHPGDTIVTTTVINMVLPKDKPEITIRCMDCSETISEVKG